jgi:hypothetical protein
LNDRKPIEAAWELIELLDLKMGEVAGYSD